MKPDSLAITRAVELCVSRGLVSLDDPVEQYWPECPSLGVTVRELVEGADGGMRDESVSELVRRVDGREVSRFIAEEKL